MESFFTILFPVVFGIGIVNAIISHLDWLFQFDRGPWNWRLFLGDFAYDKWLDKFDQELSDEQVDKEFDRIIDQTLVDDLEFLERIEGIEE